MEKMKINSKRGYLRDRVVSGHEPHKMLDMIQNQMLGKLSKASKKDVEIAPSYEDSTEVKK